jgi:excisionase family DNA binding protein
VSDLARALVAELARDPEALERLRALVAPEALRSGSAPAFTVRSLAAELGRSERSIRAAIARGELDAIKRGRGYVISRDAVEAWATGSTSSPRFSPPRPCRRPGVMARALKP